MNNLQKCYCVENLYPTIECCNDIYYIQYDIDNNHIRFEITEKNIHNRLYLNGIKRKVIEWISEVSE